MYASTRLARGEGGGWCEMHIAKIQMSRQRVAAGSMQAQFERLGRYGRAAAPAAVGIILP